eukprot:gnl/TRDRNA2_/TRDRNA2_110909_c0_seq1.p1 gnl/TRDRNA2_/TRDRNA2_110909_c0~~gnl/TRDRNA2_/TRDRNA2_110909_c0_seq1.p1  ORF type:complete len:336 (-),score=26.55 gnl/TRDRNA2_/TRDRNA2_110909_c0_seq1:175-1149(-)
MRGVDPDVTILQLKERLQSESAWAPELREQKLVWQEKVLSDGTQTISKLGIPTGTTISVVRIPFCPTCRGPCRCPTCHGNAMLVAGFCPTCDQRGICWGGDTYVLLPCGAAQKIRDCNVNDEVLTLKGSRRIARIWDSISRKCADTEVCCIDGVWLTSHHPIISGSRWVFPVDLGPSLLWRNALELVPDLYNFELEGHDDTILLWGGNGWPLVVSCTIGKYLGPSYGCTYATRRSTRCRSPCAQCNAVYMEGLDFGRIPSNLRWAKFPAFPQVDWDCATESEFDLADAHKMQFVPPKQVCAPHRMESMASPIEGLGHHPAEIGH